MSECLVMDGVEIKKVTGMGTTPVALEAPSMHHRPRNDLANRSSAEFASASLGKRPLASVPWQVRQEGSRPNMVGMWNAVRGGC